MRQSAREAPRVLRALRAVAAEGFDASCEIDRVAAEPAFGQDDGDFGRAFRFALVGRVDRHAGETRRQRQARDRAALFGDEALGIDGADRRQQRPGFAERAARRGVEERELVRIGDAPQRAGEREPREVGGEDFRRGVGLKAAVRGLFPQPIADSGPGAARAPPPLVGVGPG